MMELKRIRINSLDGSTEIFKIQKNHLKYKQNFLCTYEKYENKIWFCRNSKFKLVRIALLGITIPRMSKGVCKIISFERCEHETNDVNPLEHSNKRYDHTNDK